MRECCLNQVFESKEQAMEKIRTLMEGPGSANEMPVKDFGGLTPNIIQDFLYRPFDNRHVSFDSDNKVFLEAPMMKAFLFLVDAIGEKGLKATSKGNLPRKVFRAIFDILNPELDKYLPRGSAEFMSEEECPDVFRLRCAAEEGGLIRLHGGVFRLRIKVKRALARKKPESLYLDLFKAFTRDLNLVFGTDLEDFQGSIQRCFLFSLYLLHRRGKKPEGIDWYGNTFLKAFPHSLHEFQGASDEQMATVIRAFHMTYLSAFFMNLLEPMGLVILTDQPKTGDFMKDLGRKNLEKGLLFDLFIKFHV